MLDGIYDLFDSVITPHYSNAEGAQRIAERIDVHSFENRPELEGARVAIFGVLEGRKSGDNEGCSEGPQRIRECLYRLTPHSHWQTTIDLGNLRPGVTETDTIAAVQSIVGELTQQGIVPVILGGGQDLTTAMYKALEPFGRPVQLVTMDSRLDFGADPDQGTSRNFMNDIILHEPNYLFNYTNIGHQGFLTDPDTLDLLEKLQFESIRLGQVMDRPDLIEPILRDADLVSIDVGAIRGCDHTAHAAAGPNGVDARTACQLARYAGMSDNLKAIGIFEHNPDLDNRDLGAQLIGQMIWHILDGIYAQKSDFPKCPLEEYAKYVVDLSDVEQAIVFYKSSRSDRWWMEIPYPHRNEQKQIVGCSYEDYLEASEGKMPERWWKTVQKLN
jgi:arginase family enzyme